MDGIQCGLGGVLAGYWGREMDGDGPKCRCFGEMAHRARIIPRYTPFIWGSVVSAVVLSAGGMQGRDVKDGGTITRPEFAGRVTRAFDFEEMFTNPLPVPKGWIRAQHDPEVPRDRPGFPIWNRAGLDYESPAYGGKGSVHLPTEGGSTSLILRHGELAVFPNADYLISTRVRTEGLHHAQARMVATLIDRAGQDIEGTEVATRLVQTRGEWEVITVQIEGTEPSAAFVRVELQLLQPEQQPRDRQVKPFKVWSQDFEGGAWFDDVVVAQVPMIGLSTGVPGNVVASKESPTLKMSVRDLTGDDLSSYIRVFDASGALVDQMGDRSGTGEEWGPALDGYGWYHAVYDVMSHGSLVGRQELNFIWQPPRARGDVAGGFGAKRYVPKDSLFALRTDSLDEKLLAAIPELSKKTGVKNLEMRAWDMTSKKEDLVKGSSLVTAIDAVIGSGIQLSLSLSEVPMELADQAAIDHDAIFALLMDHKKIALPVLGPFMDRYGQQISDWRLGTGALEDKGEKLAGEIDEIVRVMDPYVPGAVIGVSWAMDRPFESVLSSDSLRLMVMDDPSYPDEALSDMIQQWSQTTGLDQSNRRLSVVHRSYSTDGNRGSESVWSRVGWLGRRAINAWWESKLNNPGNDQIEIVLSDPWTIEPGRRGRVMPQPELLVWRTLVDHLGGRGAVEEIDLMPGVRMLLCSGRDDEDESAEGALIVWLDEPSIEAVMIDFPLSTGGVEVVDLFGNVSQVGITHKTELSLPSHRIEVSRTPLIITGVNAGLVRFLANLRLTPDQFDATSGIHKHQVVIKNPWPFSIRGRVYLIEPGGFSGSISSIADRSWDIKPRVMNFAVTGGLEERFDLDISYSAAQLAGIKDLVFDVELEADQDYGLMRVARQIELGTDMIEVELTIRKIAGENSDGRVEVGVVVTNLNQERLLVDLVAIAPKNPSRESTISKLEPSKNARRSFVFDRLARGDEVIISVRVPGQGVQINKSIKLP